MWRIWPICVSATVTMRAVAAIDALAAYAVKGWTTMAWAEVVGAWTMENEKKLRFSFVLSMTCSNFAKAIGS